MADKKASWFKRHKILTVVLGLFAVIVVISGSNASKEADKAFPAPSASDQQPAAKASTNKAAAAKIGTAVRDGKFEFTVNSIECGKTSVGSNQYLSKTPQGQFCFMAVTVKNIGNEAQSMFSQNQKLLNAQGQEYAADDTATIYAAPNSNTWYSNINPGNSVEGTIVFDVPKDQTPVTAELHDSAYSGGVKVSLQ